VSWLPQNSTVYSYPANNSRDQIPAFPLLLKVSDLNFLPVMSMTSIRDNLKQRSRVNGIYAESSKLSVKESSAPVSISEAVTAKLQRLSNDRG
jgi:hypothetical protein